MRIVSFNANGLRSAASKGFFDWFAQQDADVLCVQETKAQEHQLGRATTASCPDGYKAWFRDATTKKGYSGVAIYAQARARRGAHRARLGRVRRGRPLHRGALRQPERGVVLHPVGFVGRIAPGLQVRGDGRGSSRSSTSGWPAAATTCCAATGTSCARALDIRNWKSNQKNSGCLPRRARLAQRPVHDDGTAGSTRIARCMPKARTTPGGATAARRAPRTSAGASTTRSSRRRCATGCVACSIHPDAALLRPRAVRRGLRRHDRCRRRDAKPAKPSVWKAFTQPAAWTMFFFGFSSGPAVPAGRRHAGVLAEGQRHRAEGNHDHRQRRA